jgi:hypothetical protein
MRFDLHKPFKTKVKMQKTVRGELINPYISIRIQWTNKIYKSKFAYG